MKNELYHHGILGQRWGKRNGPPYPLAFGAHSKAEKSLNPKKRISSGNGSTASKKEMAAVQLNSRIDARRNASDTFKSIIKSKEFKVGATVAVAVLATYGAYKLTEINTTNKAYQTIANISKPTMADILDKVDDGSVFEEFTFPDGPLKDYYFELVDTAKAGFDSLPKKYMDLSQLPKAEKDYLKDVTVDSILSEINHGADIYTNDMRNQNCGLCSMSIIARLKGFNVTAGETPNALPREILEECFDGAKFLKSNTNNPRAIIKGLTSKGDGSYGILFVPWKTGGAHFISYIVDNGSVRLLDGQIEKEWDQKELFNRTLVNNIFVMDCTNANFTDKALHCFM